MKRTLFALIVGLTTLPSAAAAASITFDLRDSSIELIDEVNSFDLTEDGLTATLAALPETYYSHDVVLNQTTSAFGINVVGTSCGDSEDSTRLDGGCTGESIDISFSEDVYLNSLKVSSFSLLGLDTGLVTIDGALLALPILSTGVLSLGNVFLAAGSSLNVAYLTGNGFSLDNFTVTRASVAEPGSLLLLSLGVLGMAAFSRRRV
jgi:hypothetical protein